MKVGIVVFPGSNCDLDVKYAVQDVMGHEAEYIWHRNKDVGKYDCIVLPGGFSYGDYLRGGAIARFSPVMEAVSEYALGGGLVLGICNGFQILLEAGLLPGAMRKNDNLQFRCQNTHLRVVNSKTPFTNACRKGEILQIPIAHSDGNYYADAETLKELEDSGRVVFRYCNPSGEPTPESNPNGSVNNIAGICNHGGNVLGMMPHPERCMEEIMSGTDGVKIFISMINFLEGGGGLE
ncbi:MAG TPA: phosphoribosylformylglycinamidine synthase subunit PurQ [Clostridia bacterium]|nr:phosphoribosylformylglycinamidine synthase subunit PurQ [Clostridia bacterium]